MSTRSPTIATSTSAGRSPGRRPGSRRCWRRCGRKGPSPNHSTRLGPALSGIRSPQGRTCSCIGSTSVRGGWQSDRGRRAAQERISRPARRKRCAPGSRSQADLMSAARRQSGDDIRRRTRRGRPPLPGAARSRASTPSSAGGTLAALNVLRWSGRIDQIRANLERHRWLAPAINEDSIIVDIARFRMYLGGRQETSSGRRKSRSAKQYSRHTGVQGASSSTWSSIPPGRFHPES